MNNYKLLTTIIATTLILVACNRKQEHFVINGETNNVKDSTMLFLSDIDTDRTIDTTFVVNNKFSFRGKVDGVKNYWLRLKGYRDYRSMWIENYNYHIDAKSTTLRKAHISGGVIQQQDNELIELDKPLENKIDSLMKLYRKTDRTNNEKRKSLRKEVEKLRNNKWDVMSDFIKDHPDYQLSAYYLTFVKHYVSKDKTRELYNCLTTEIKENSWGKQIKLYLEKAVDLKVGDKAIDFTMEDIDNKSVTLSSFKGKYLLLEFWSSGCGPCRFENPIIRKAYNKYKINDFEVLGVCLDRNKDRWQGAVKKDSINWTTVCDYSGNKGEVPITYSISYIPTNFLIDKSGTIIAKDVRGVNLHKKLEKLFNNRELTKEEIDKLKPKMRFRRPS